MRQALERAVFSVELWRKIKRGKSGKARKIAVSRINLRFDAVGLASN
jgi:hypothetical protein